MMDKKISGPLNLGNPVEISHIKNLAKEIIELIGSKSKIINQKASNR